MNAVIRWLKVQQLHRFPVSSRGGTVGLPVGLAKARRRDSAIGISHGCTAQRVLHHRTERERYLRYRNIPGDGANMTCMVDQLRLFLSALDELTWSGAGQSRPGR
jgi:hypothetical protein